MKTKKKTKPYETLLDRNWKGKEWFTSWRSYKNIRKLTEEEASPLLEAGTIKEVIMPKYEKDIVGDVMKDGQRTGRMFCNKCGGTTGFYIKKRPFGKEIEIFTCADCGVREIKPIK